MSPTTKTLPESSSSTEPSPERGDLDNNHRFWDLRGVQWRTDLGVLPSSSSVDDVRRVTANSRRSYAALRRRLLIDPLIPKDGSNFPDPVMDNPLSQDPDSMWGRFFQKAELEKMVDQDLSRLYPEHGSYFQTPGCQALLRRILLLWCISHPNYGYRQGMHELLAPLLYVLQADVERLSAVRKLYEHYFTDNFEGLSFHETDSAYKSNLKRISQDDSGIEEIQLKVNNLNELDPKIQTIISFSDAYGAEGELGIVLSEKFIEHDAYCMFDALMNGTGGAVAMANFFSPPQNGLPPVIEASSAVYHLLSAVDSSLYTHLIELEVEPQYFALRWLRVLFGREFALEDLLVIWDGIFSFDNSRLDGLLENDSEISFAVLNSARGAFIAALAVSMILYIRSSVLATETATSCLQRLLNFPEDVNLAKLLRKANSLVSISIDAMRSMPPPVYERSKPTAATGSPVSVVVRGSYWEEKWRVLHKEEEKKETGPPKQVRNQRKGWSEKVKLPLLRTESDPSSLKVNREKPGPSRPHVRRNLLDDLARQLGLEEETEKLASEDDRKTGFLTGNGGGIEENSPIFSNPPSLIDGTNDNDHDLAQQLGLEEETEKLASEDDRKTGFLTGNGGGSEENSPIFSDPPSPIDGTNDNDHDLARQLGLEEETETLASEDDRKMGFLTGNGGGSEENSPIFSNPLSPIDGTNDDDHEIDTERSSVASNILVDENELEPSTAAESLTIPEGSSPGSNAPENAHLKPGQNEDSTGKLGLNLKERILSSGKFQWFWKLAKNGGEGSLEKGGGAPDSTDSSATDVSKGESVNQNKTCSLKNLGQSMVENLQVIESVFQQEKGETGHADNLLKKALVDRGQMTAMAALKELRKISNILSEM